MSNKTEATFHGRTETSNTMLAAEIASQLHEGEGAIMTEAEIEQALKYEPVERESIGDWVDVQTRIVENGISELVEIAGTNSRDHGFHDDWPVFPGVTSTATGEPAPGHEHLLPAHERQVGLFITEKIALIHEEVSEALGEIRSGIAPTKVYYRDTKGIIGPNDDTYDDQHFDDHDENFKGVTPLLKPEGFGIELADAMIRIADLAYLTGVDLGAAILEKHAYNKTRPAKHGRKF